MNDTEPQEASPLSRKQLQEASPSSKKKLYDLANALKLACRVLRWVPWTKQPARHSLFYELAHKARLLELRVEVALGSTDFEPLEPWEILAMHGYAKEMDVCLDETQGGYDFDFEYPRQYYSAICVEVLQLHITACLEVAWNCAIMVFDGLDLVVAQCELSPAVDHGVEARIKLFDTAFFLLLWCVFSSNSWWAWGLMRFDIAHQPILTLDGIITAALRTWPPSTSLCTNCPANCHWMTGSVPQRMPPTMATHQRPMTRHWLDFGVPYCKSAGTLTTRHALHKSL